MVHLFREMNEMIDCGGCRTARGFSAYSGEKQYCICTKPFKRIRLTDEDVRVLQALARFPLLSPGCLADVAGIGAAERVARLYQAGILSRFAEERREDEGLIASVYYISENGHNLTRKVIRSMGFPPGSVEEMSVPKRIEVSVLSRWLAYAEYFCKNGGTALKAFGMPDREHPYLEAVMHKVIRRSWRKGNLRCRFHIICRPKDRAAIPLFTETLVYFEELAMREEQELVKGCSRSYVVILCESDEDMESLALGLDNTFKSRGMEGISGLHFLYALESDAMDELGAFKFLSDISFPDGMVRRQQKAFK